MCTKLLVVIIGVLIAIGSGVGVGEYFVKNKDYFKSILKQHKEQVQEQEEQHNGFSEV